VVHALVVDPRVVFSTTLVERCAVLLEVRAVIPGEEATASAKETVESKERKTHSGPITVMKITNAATTPMRIPCTFA
jgi:hypothetical protein